MDIFRVLVWIFPMLVVVGIIVRVIEKSKPYTNSSETDGRRGVLGYGILFLALLDLVIVGGWAIVVAYNTP